MESVIDVLRNQIQPGINTSVSVLLGSLKLMGNVFKRVRISGMMTLRHVQLEVTSIQTIESVSHVLMVV